jgi:tripartite-type tricarboxylate transporter receptor subunit TctC
VIVPFPAGGVVDLVTRAVTDRLAVTLKQPFLVEARPGANGNIGTEAAARAAPDGYTLLLSSADTYSMYPALYPNPKFISAEFVPIAPAAVVNFVLMGRPGLEAKNVPELIALAKKGKLSYSSWGNGSAGHIAMAQFLQVTKTEMLHVPYQGAAPAAQAAMGGQVDLALVPAPLAAGFKTKLIPYGVASAKRVELINEIPTLTEQGTPVVAPSWVGVVAPPKTPDNIIATLAKAFIETSADPEVGKRLNAAGLVPLYGSTKEFADYITKDYAFWGKAIRDAGIKVEN